MELNGAKILYTIHTNIPLLGDFKITQTLVSTWIVMALLSGLAIWLVHGLKLLSDFLQFYHRHCRIAKKSGQK